MSDAMAAPRRAISTIMLRIIGKKKAAPATACICGSIVDQL
jgi:hypothetical protein